MCVSDHHGKIFAMRAEKKRKWKRKRKTLTELR
jgi:hypothetical protein